MKDELDNIGKLYNESLLDSNNNIDIVDWNDMDKKLTKLNFSKFSLLSVNIYTVSLAVLITISTSVFIWKSNKSDVIPQKQNQEEISIDKNQSNIIPVTDTIKEITNDIKAENDNEIIIPEITPSSEKSIIYKIAEPESKTVTKQELNNDKVIDKSKEDIESPKSLDSISPKKKIVRKVVKRKVVVPQKKKIIITDTVKIKKED